MESDGALLAHGTSEVARGFGTTEGDLLAAAPSNHTSLGDNSDLTALFGTLKAFSARALLTSELEHLNPVETISVNQIDAVEALNHELQNLLVRQPTDALVLLNNARSTTAFSHGTGKDFLTGSNEHSPLVGSFSDDLTDRTSSTNQPIAALPDLSGEFGKVKLPPRTLIPDAKGNVKLIITNQGGARARGPLEIDLLASTDAILDANDQVISSLERPKFALSPSLSKTYTLDFTNPEGVAPGAYYLLADIDVDNAIAESNEINLASTRVSARGTDTVLDWNATLLNAIATDKTAPPVAARNMAIVHTAIYAAVYAIDQLRDDYRDYLEAIAPGGVSRRAAVAAAAYRALVDLFPTQTATFDTQLALSLAEVADGQAESNGVTLGQSIADLILAWRSNDGSSDTVSYTPGTEPGDWQPTPPGFLPALLPQWPNVRPFVITSGSQFRPQGPPALDSAEYAAELNQVKRLGRLNSSTRTAEQTEIAQFWADGAGTFTPPGHWNLIAEQVALAQKNTLSENARLFALLNIAEADAGIASWDAKYKYNFWRPVTAIQQADTDGNPDTTADPSWTPLLTTPPFPEYPSGHSTFSGAADAVLTSFFGDISFTTTSVGLPGVIRSFNSFTEAANEAGISRIYGGIHFQSANEDGLALGRAVGSYVSHNFLVS